MEIVCSASRSCRAEWTAVEMGVKWMSDRHQSLWGTTNILFFGNDSTQAPKGSTDCRDEEFSPSLECREVMGLSDATTDDL